MADIEKLREEHWHKFVKEYIEPLKDFDFPQVECENEYNNYKVIRINDDIKINPTMPELNFIYELVKAQNNKRKLLPYLWVYAMSFYTFNVSDYCIKRLKKTLEANGFESYQGEKHSVRFVETEFDDSIRDKLDDADLKGKDFVKIVKDFINDYKIINE